MDNCCAPQWTDFTCSPQIPSDNYFEIEHEVHKPRIQSVAETDFEDSLEIEETVVTNVAYFVPYEHKIQAVEQVNNDNGLRKALTNLNLDGNSQKAHCSWNVSITELATLSDKRKTALERIKMNIRTLKMKNPSDNNQTIKSVDGKKDTLTKNKSKLMVQSEIDRPEQEKVNFLEKRLSFKVYRRQSAMFKKRKSLGKSRPTVLVYQHRRQSLVKNRRSSNRFVSLAEAVSKFQTGTPQRFRTISNKDLKPGPLMKLKRSPLKLTVPVSPSLRCKQRTRHTTVLSEKEREALKLEEMKKNQVKANPVPVNILKMPAVLKKVPKKPVTVIKKFNLTQPKKIAHATNIDIRPQNNVDKEPSRKTALPIVRSASTSNIPNKKDVKFPVRLTENNVKNTKNMSFNFEARNKEFQLKKEEKLKILQDQELNKIKGDFHARRVPNFAKLKNPVKESSLKRRTVIPCPFSFAERDRNTAKKKEELVKQKLESDKKTRIFHATPVPVFKPVTVLHASKEKAQNKEKTIPNSKDSAMKQANFHDQENKQPNIMPNAATHADVNNKEVKQEVLNKKQTKDVANDKLKSEQTIKKHTKPKFECHSDKRAKERSEFDERIRKKEQEQEAKRLEEEKNRLAKEKIERAELRRLAEVKARPMPVYKPMVIQKSLKPPTSPRTPVCVNRNKPKHVL